MSWERLLKLKDAENGCNKKFIENLLISTIIDTLWDKLKTNQKGSLCRCWLAFLVI